MSNANITPYTLYRNFQRRRKYRSLTPEENERADGIERALFLRALKDAHIEVEHNEDVSFKSRRSRIFESFRGEDYQNDVTRLSIIRSLININKVWK